MIVYIFLIFNYVVNIVKNRLFRERPKLLDDETAILLLDSLDIDTVGIHDEEIGVRFIPPAYLQRYNAICQILSQLHHVFNITKVIDIGCAELGLFSRLKRYDFIQEYIGVDKDLYTIEKSASRIKPLTTDFLNKRSTPLKILILDGNASDPDKRIKDANAVVAIELIEHMYPPELDDLPYNIFGIVQPEVAIFTTPNADFNRFFKKLDPNKFRHYDHKFEWSRSQFEDWGNNLVSRYPSYKVWYHGIAFGPEDTMKYGSCSQMAVFIRREEKMDSASEFGVYYKVVHELQYPYRTSEEKANDALQYEVFQFIERCRQHDTYLDDETYVIPLADIISNINVFCTQQKLREFLKKSGRTVEYVDNQFILLDPLYPDDNLSDSSSVSSFDENINYVFLYQQNEKKNLNREDEVEVWDGDMNNPQSNNTVCGPDRKSDFEDVLDRSQILHRKHDDIKNGEQSQPTNEDVSVENSKVNESEKMKDNFQCCTRESGAIPKASKSNARYLETATTSKKVMEDDRIIEVDHVSEIIARNDSFPDPERGLFDGSTEIGIKSSNFFHIKNGEKYLQSNLRSNKDKNSKLGETIDDLPEISTPNCEEKEMENFKGPLNEIEDRIVQGSCFQLTSPGTFPRSHSLENINIYNAKKNNFRRSLNIDSTQQDCDTRIVDMDLDICIKGWSPPSLTETCGSQSKAADSGYPNSVQEMDLDRTPEQVEEIVTETESSLEDEESSGDERVVEQVQGNPPIVFVDNVENGDVANNNRDGEGNNMEGGQVLGEEEVFEDLLIGVEEVEGEVESEDEGLFMSALDTSNNTVVAEELSLSEHPLYLYDLHSTSSNESIRAEDNSDDLLPLYGFPPWLLNMIPLEDDDEGSGDAGPDRAEDSSESVIDREGQVNLYPGDARAGGEPTPPED